LEFCLDGVGEGVTNSSVTRGDARLMIETADDFYGDAYNEAIRERLGTPSSTALYIESEDLAGFHSRPKAGGVVRIVDPLASRPWGQEEFTIEDPAGNWLTFWAKSNQRRPVSEHRPSEEPAGGSVVGASPAPSSAHDSPARGRASLRLA